MLWQIMASKVVSSKDTYDPQATWHGVPAAGGMIDLGYCRPRLHRHAKSATVHQRREYSITSIFRITEAADPQPCGFNPQYRRRSSPADLPFVADFVIPEDKFGKSERDLVRREIISWGHSDSPVEGHSTWQIRRQLDEIPLA